MSTIDEIRAAYREILTVTLKALSDAEDRERTRLEVRAAAMALDAAKEARRLVDVSERIGKLRAKVEDYTARLKATGSQT